MGSGRGQQDYDILTESDGDDDLERSNLSEGRNAASASMASICVTLGRLLLTV